MAVASSTTSMHTHNILKLKFEYDDKPDCCFYNDLAFHIVRPGEIGANSFIGSSTLVELHSTEDSILFDSPGCLAAPVVNLIALRSIRLGTHERSPYSASKKPLRLFAANILYIKTEHLIIGNLDLLVRPFVASVTCSKLTIVNFSQQQPPALLEIVKKWLLNPITTQIEVVKPT